MTRRKGMGMCSSGEGVCGNNAVQFQSCDGSSYCTALGENGWCINILSRHLRDSYVYQISERAIQKKKWSGMLTRGIMLLHDNARPHTAHATRVHPRRQWHDFFKKIVYLNLIFTGQHYAINAWIVLFLVWHASWQENVSTTTVRYRRQWLHGCRCWW